MNSNRSLYNAASMLDNRNNGTKHPSAGGGINSLLIAVNVGKLVWKYFLFLRFQ